MKTLEDKVNELMDSAAFPPDGCGCKNVETTTYYWELECEIGYKKVDATGDMLRVDVGEDSEIDRRDLRAKEDGKATNRPGYFYNKMNKRKEYDIAVYEPATLRDK